MYFEYLNLCLYMRKIWSMSVNVNLQKWPGNLKKKMDPEAPETCCEAAVLEKPRWNSATTLRPFCDQLCNYVAVTWKTLRPLSDHSATTRGSDVEIIATTISRRCVVVAFPDSPELVSSLSRRRSRRWVVAGLNRRAFLRPPLCRRYVVGNSYFRRHCDQNLRRN